MKSHIASIAGFSRLLGTYADTGGAAPQSTGCMATTHTDIPARLDRLRGRAGIGAW